MEHLDGLRRQTESSVLAKHWQEHHGDKGEPPEYSFKVKEVHKSATSRQLSEALEIAESDADIPLNEKNELDRNGLVIFIAKVDENIRISFLS